MGRQRVQTTKPLKQCDSRVGSSTTCREVCSHPRHKCVIGGCVWTCVFPGRAPPPWPAAPRCSVCPLAVGPVVAACHIVCRRRQPPAETPRVLSRGRPVCALLTHCGHLLFSSTVRFLCPSLRSGALPGPRLCALPGDLPRASSWRPEQSVLSGQSPVSQRYCPVLYGLQ